MGVEKLIEDSLPCTICEELSGDLRDEKTLYSNCPEFKNGSCNYKDRAMLKLLYLNYLNGKKK